MLLLALLLKAELCVRCRRMVAVRQKLGDKQLAWESGQVRCACAKSRVLARVCVIAQELFIPEPAKCLEWLNDAQVLVGFKKEYTVIHTKQGSGTHATSWLSPILISPADLYPACCA
jgi:hypothetical protein